MDTSIVKRFVLFLLGCMVVRWGAAYGVYKYPQFAKYGSFIALAIVLGWLTIILVKPRDAGPEVFGDKIWWQPLRIAHVIFYLLFAVLSWTHPTIAYVPLTADAALGLLSFFVYHSS